MVTPTVSFSPGSQSTYTKSAPVTVTISDSESGLKADQSGNSRNGTIVGATRSVNSLYFDGSNDYVRIAQLNYQNVTLESSFRFKSLPSSEAHIISNVENGGYNLAKAGSTSGSKIYGAAYKGSEYKYAYSMVPSAGPTYYGATTANSEYVKSAVYAATDKRTASVDSSIAITNTTKSTYMVLGANPLGSGVESTGFFNGWMYTARMYSSVFSDDQLQKHYVIDRARFGY